MLHACLIIWVRVRGAVNLNFKFFTTTSSTAFLTRRDFKIEVHELQCTLILIHPWHKLSDAVNSYSDIDRDRTSRIDLQLYTDLLTHFCIWTLAMLRRELHGIIRFCSSWRQNNVRFASIMQNTWHPLYLSEEPQLLSILSLIVGWLSRIHIRKLAEEALKMKFSEG